MKDTILLLLAAFIGIEMLKPPAPAQTAQSNNPASWLPNLFSAFGGAPAQNYSQSYLGAYNLKTPSAANTPGFSSDGTPITGFEELPVNSGSGYLGTPDLSLSGGTTSTGGDYQLTDPSQAFA